MDSSQANKCMLVLNNDDKKKKMRKSIKKNRNQEIEQMNR